MIFAPAFLAQNDICRCAEREDGYSVSKEFGKATCGQFFKTACGIHFHCKDTDEITRKFMTTQAGFECLWLSGLDRLKIRKDERAVGQFPGFCVLRQGYAKRGQFCRVEPAFGCLGSYGSKPLGDIVAFKIRGGIAFQHKLPSASGVFFEKSRVFKVAYWG